MSLYEAAGRLAEHLGRQEFVEVYAHHDADGIAAGSILCMALLRRDVRFRLRVVTRLSPAEISADTPTLLCDLGSGIDDLPDGVMVVDHHIPHYSGELQVNPRLHEVDGDHDLSSAGAAYLVAQGLGDNRDLASLVMLGIIGDGQMLRGPNLEIFNEAVAEGIITPGNGYLLPGRDEHERLYAALNPYLHQVSGDEMAVADLLESASSGEELSREKLLSLLVLRISPYAPVETLEGIYGATYSLEREVIPDAHALTAVVDACGKAGFGGLAASLCLRSPGDLADAWNISFQHRGQVISALRAACTTEESPGYCEVDEMTIASDVADALSRDCLQKGPVVVSARNEELCHMSIRSPRGIEMNVGVAVREAALQCGGFGGGHRLRAGATIPFARIGEFRALLAKMVAV